MNRYLFMFGYETPEVAAYNRELGTDDEDCQAIFIQAQNREDALIIGKNLANQFFVRLYRGSGLDHCVDDYAHWIEDDPTGNFSVDDLADIPVIAYDDLVAAEQIVQEWMDNA